MRSAHDCQVLGGVMLAAVSETFALPKCRTLRDRECFVCQFVGKLVRCVVGGLATAEASRRRTEVVAPGLVAGGKKIGHKTAPDQHGSRCTLTARSVPQFHVGLHADADQEVVNLIHVEERILNAHAVVSG